MKNMIKYLTPEGLEKLKKELNYLKIVKRREIAETLQHTASFGDLSENFAYQQAKEDQSFLEGRILELEEIIRSSQVIKKQEQSERVQIGSIVLVSLNGKKPRTRTPKQNKFATGQTSLVRGREKFQIVGPEEANPQEGKISFESPLGKALLGKKVGNKIKFEALNGKLESKILKIE